MVLEFDRCVFSRFLEERFSPANRHCCMTFVIDGMFAPGKVELMVLKYPTSIL